MKITNLGTSSNEKVETLIREPWCRLLLEEQALASLQVHPEIGLINKFGCWLERKMYQECLIKSNLKSSEW